MTWPLRSRISRPIVIALALAGVACGMSSASAGFSADGAPSPADTALDPDASFAADASGGGASATKGSPLCSWPQEQNDNRCKPDVEGDQIACNDGGAAVVPSGDAGAAGSDAATPTTDAGRAASDTGCRVALDSLGRKAPVCNAAGLGRDGAACQKSTDCAAGYDCSSDGVCRHYCCNGTCTSVAQDGSKTFCDVQQLREATSIKVPLCMPIRHCELFGTQCKPDETCSLVNTDGDTACVAKGTATVDESCEDTHCQAGDGQTAYVCLGAIGSRKCEQLCHLNTYDCKSAAHPRCEGSSFFPQGFGVCK